MQLSVRHRLSNLGNGTTACIVAVKIMAPGVPAAFMRSAASRASSTGPRKFTSKDCLRRRFEIGNTHRISRKDNDAVQLRNVEEFLAIAVLHEVRLDMRPMSDNCCARSRFDL